MRIQNEQMTNTTITSPPEQENQAEAGFPSRTSMTQSSSTDSANGYVPHWEEYQGTYAQPGNTIRAAVFGGLAGGIFFFGLVAAILSGHFLPVFLVALAICTLVGSLSSSKAQAIYGGFQGFVFFLGLAVCSVVGFWPWILVVLGIAAILGSLNGLWGLGPVARPSIIVDQYYSAIRNHDYSRAYRFLDASLASSLTLAQFTQMAQEQDEVYGPVSSYVIAPGLATTPLPGEPLPLVTFASNPAENVTVTVTRAHGPSYTVHLQGRQVGKAWKITAFYRI
jgi:hypothetical protein